MAGPAIFSLIVFFPIGMLFCIVGVRLLRNKAGWGTRFTKRTMWSKSRWSVETTRKTVGVGYVVLGAVFFAVGLAFFAENT